jgi:hypothetical protein
MISPCNIQREAKELDFPLTRIVRRVRIVRNDELDNAVFQWMYYVYWQYASGIESFVELRESMTEEQLRKIFKQLSDQL